MKKNELTRKIRIRIIVLSILLFLVTITGITYAYFSIQVTGNEEASSIRVSTARLSLIYTDTLLLGGDRIKPEWTQSKTISVENNGTVPVYYNIIWRDLLNEITDDELVISGTCISDVSGNTCDNISETIIPTATTLSHNIAIKNNIEIAVGETHTYTVTVTFKETYSNQNYNQNKEFYGTLNISEGRGSTAENCFTTSGSQITGYTCDDTDIIIPSKINGTAITSIGQQAFFQKGLTAVVIPDGVTSIENIAFYNNQIASLTIPSSVTSIGTMAFMHNSISTVKITYSQGYNTLNDIYVSGSISGFQSLIIENGITTISNDVFCDNCQIASLEIPRSVASIGNNAFKNCKLTSITIPNGVVSIGNSAFFGNLLTSVTTPSSVMSIGDSAFSGGSNKLTSVIIKGKSSLSDFTTYGTSIWNWDSGYSDADIVWEGLGN